MAADKEHPVLTGLLALVGVAVALGVVAALSVVAGAHVLGLGNGHAANTGGNNATLFLPKPKKTQAASGPSITLGSEPTSTTSTKKPDLTIHKRKKQISLQAGESSVSPMGRIDLTGTYPGGEGAVLNVQKYSNGSWQDFYSISATVTNSTFTTYIQTGTPGVNRFRVIDSDSQQASNEVRVTIG